MQASVSLHTALDTALPRVNPQTIESGIAASVSLSSERNSEMSEERCARVCRLGAHVPHYVVMHVIEDPILQLCRRAVRPVTMGLRLAVALRCAADSLITMNYTSRFAPSAAQEIFGFAQ